MTTDNPTTPRPPVPGDPFGLVRHHGEEPPPERPLDGRSNRFALLRLLVVVAAVLGAAYAAGVGETVVLVGCLVLCIVAHELGHFLTAKAARMKVTEFFVGFGPRLWSVRRGETEYGVKALPLGGYCRIIGMTNLEEVDPADEPRTYRQRPVWRRLTVAVAGSCMHFLIAFGVLFAMFGATGDVSGYLPVPGNSPIIAIEGLAHGPSPAQRAGFHLGDRIEAVDGHHFATFSAMRTYIAARPDTRLSVEVDRHGHLLTLHPRTVNLQQVAVTGVGAAATKVSHPTGFIGFEVSSVVHSSLGASVVHAAGDWWHISSVTLGAFGRLLTLHGIQSYAHLLASPSAAAHPGPHSVRFESPVGIVVLLHQAAGAGLAWVLYLLAAINLSLGIFNLVPLLPLDGGHVVIALYEGVRGAIRRRPYHADVAKLLPVFYLAIALIAFLGISALFLDIRQLAT
ncbi:MAG TPA: RIP metalloprotease [Acidimicrobiales bacterium]|nr:RIP metalloprotease [Acidimicrobiales bacterium]